MVPSEARAPNQPGGSAGFSLAEALVALTVAAIMAAMLARFVAGTRSNAAKIAELAEMATLGETLLARIASSQNLQRGRTEGRHASFAWRLDIAPASFEARALRITEKAARRSGAGGEPDASTAMPGGGSTASASRGLPRGETGWMPYRIALRIVAPSGQSHAVDTIRLGPGGAP